MKNQMENNFKIGRVDMFEKTYASMNLNLYKKDENEYIIALNLLKLMNLYNGYTGTEKVRVKIDVLSEKISSF